MLDLDDRLEEPEEIESAPPRQRHAFKREILKVMVDHLELSGKIVNPSKCLTDLSNREAKATTGLGRGMAMPHVRTLQAKELILCWMWSHQGFYFNSLDGTKIHLFVGMVAPPYDDKLYLRMMSTVARAMEQNLLIPMMEEAWTPSQVMGEICRLRVDNP